MGLNLVVLLAVLKLSGAIKISWPWVLSPLLFGLVFGVLTLAVLAVLVQAFPPLPRFHEV